MATVQRDGKMKASLKGGRDLFIVKEQAVDEALRRASRHALSAHKSAGRPVATWKDGRVAVVPAEQIAIERTPAKVRK